MNRTSQKHSDYKNIEDAMNLVMSIAGSINEQMRLMNQRQEYQLFSFDIKFLVETSGQRSVRWPRVEETWSHEAFAEKSECAQGHDKGLHKQSRNLSHGIAFCVRGFFTLKRRRRTTTTLDTQILARRIESTCSCDSNIQTWHRFYCYGVSYY